MKAILQTPKKDTRSEEEQNSEVIGAVEETIENIFQQVDKAMDSDKDEESFSEAPGSTIHVASTSSSKLRKKSARSRLEMYRNLPPGRQEEYEIYAGEYLREERKKKEKSKKKDKLESNEEGWKN